MNSTELILNPDGRVYHLNLKPEDISDLIITVGDPKRVALVSAHFDRIETRRESREFHTHTGYLAGRRMTVISTGIGTDNIDVVFNELHYLHSLAPQNSHGSGQLSLIRLGTSGAVRDEVALNSLVMSEYALGLDNLLHFYQWEQLSKEVVELRQQDDRWLQLPVPYATRVNSSLKDLMAGLVNYAGVTITAPGFYAPQGRSVNLPPKVDDFIGLLGKSTFMGTPVLNLEMETAGIYGLASLLGHRAVSLSVILANRATGEFSTTPEESIQKMIRSSLEMLIECSDS